MSTGRQLLCALLGAALWGMPKPPGCAAPASSADYLIEVWDAERGLPHSTVTSLAQTPDGYLWVGTLYGGLARFDGVRFVTFHAGNTPALQSAEVQRLLVDQSGKLWIGMVGEKLYSQRNGSFVLEHQESPAPNSWIHSLVVNRPGEVVISTVGGWLYRVRPQGNSNHWETFKSPDGDMYSSFCEDHAGRLWYRMRDGWLGTFADHQFQRVPTNCGLAGLRIHSLARDPQGRIWVGTDREIARWEGERFVSVLPADGPPAVNVRQLAFTSDGGLWVREDKRLRKCMAERWTVEASPWAVNFRPSTRPIEMRDDREGGIWITHPDDGLWHIRADGRVFRISKAEGLPSNQVECWFQDREGNVWVGLAGGGLARLRRRHIHTIWPEPEAHQLAARSVCEAADGAMWFGTSGHAFLRWHEGEFTTIIPPVVNTAGRDGTVCPDAAGRVWLGSVLNGVWVHETNALWQPFPASGLGVVARVLFGDSRGRMWIGNEFGLSVFERGAWRQITPAAGFPPVFVAAIAEDRMGALWIGTGNGQLYRYDPDVRRSAVHQPPDGSPATRFWALLADDEGVIWIGTLGGGLLRFTDGKFTRYTARDGLPNDHVSQLQSGPRDELWLGTRAGIARVSKPELERFARGEIRSVACVTYGRFDGLPSAECSSGFQPASWRTRDGRLWFATAKGVVNVQPAEVSFNPLPPPVVIEEVLVDGEVQHPKLVGREVLPSVEVGPGRHYLEIHFTGLSFTAPDKVRFKYRLTGLETDWVETGGRRLASYSFVPPGQYRFQVLACNNDGVWNEAGAVLALVVQPYFWQTWWFRLTGALVLVGGVGGTIGALERRKARRNLERLQQQRALEQERARIAKDIHDDLGASLTRITLLSDTARGDVGDQGPAAASLDRIARTARDLTRAMDEIVWAVNPKHDRLDSLVNYLGKFAQDFLADAGLAYRLEVPSSLPHWTLSSQVRHNLFLAFKEALHNVVKHAAAWEVRVILTLEPGGFRLAVVDNGRGFAPAGADAVGVGASARLASGNGLANMNQRLEEIGGRCEVRGAPGAGTSVTFIVRVKE